jgi:hypothetical protein
MHITQIQTIKNCLYQLKYKSATCRKNNVICFKNFSISSLFYTIIHKADFNFEIDMHAVQTTSTNMQPVAVTQVLKHASLKCTSKCEANICIMGWPNHKVCASDLSLWLQKNCTVLKVTMYPCQRVIILLQISRFWWNLIFTLLTKMYHASSDYDLLGCDTKQSCRQKPPCGYSWP